MLFSVIINLPSRQKIYLKLKGTSISCSQVYSRTLVTLTTKMSSNKVTTLGWFTQLEEKYPTANNKDVLINNHGNNFRSCLRIMGIYLYSSIKRYIGEHLTTDAKI